MADDSKAAVGADDALPMQKTGPAVKIAAGVGGAVVVGLVLFFALSGGTSSATTVSESEKAVTKTQGMTKAELEERQAHLKKTQAALIAAAQDEAAAEQQAAPPPPQAEPEPEQGASSPAAPTQRAPAPTAKAPAKKPANSKKSMDGLDALGADITSALK